MAPTPSMVRPFAAAISLSPTFGPAGTTVTVAGTGWNPVLAILITISFAGGNVSTSPSTCYAASGSFSCQFKAPSGYPGPNVVKASGGSTSASATFTETGQLLVHPRSVDVGENTSVWGGDFGHSLAIRNLTLGGRSLNCTSATIGRCVGGNVTTNSSGVFNVTFLVPSVPVSGLYEVNASDSAGKTQHANVSVYPDPTVSVITASRASADLGQTVIFNVTVWNGSGGFTYSWTGLPGCGGLYNPLTCLVGQTGTTTVRVEVQDSNGFNATSPGLSFTVYPDPRVQTPTANRSSSDIGQPVSFRAVALFGTGVYSTYAWSGLPGGCGGMGAWVNCSPTTAALTSVTVSVTDTNGRGSGASSPLAFRVYSAPVSGTPGANRSSADVGQSVAFASSASLGSGGYTYAWSGLPAGCPSPATTPWVNCTVAGAGDYEVVTVVRDSNGYASPSPPLSFAVYAAPTVTITATRTILDAGQVFALNATAAQGSGEFRYKWRGIPTGCGSSSESLVCSTAQSGSFSISVMVTDSNQGSAVSPSIVVTIAPAIVASVTWTPMAPRVGESVTFDANATGGTGPRTLAWAFGDGGSGSGSSVTHAYAMAGTYTVSLRVNDSAGGSIVKSIKLSVSTPGASGSVGTAGTPLAVYVGAAVGLGAGVAALIWWTRRRRPTKSQPELADPDT